METTKSEIIITNYKDTSASRTTFETKNHGKMSAFKNEGSTLIEDLKAHTNRLISVDISKSEKDGTTYYNIRKFYGAIAGSDTTNDEEVIEPNDFFKETTSTIDTIDTIDTQSKSHNLRKEYDKDPVGLAIEVFCARPNFTMEEAIFVVVEAQKAFN